MVALAKQNTRSNRRVRGFFDVKVMAGRSKADYNLLVALDYNTVRGKVRGARPLSSPATLACLLLQVEATMLGSAILVCLAGLMFSSSRFTGPLAGFYTNEYSGLVRVSRLSRVWEGKMGLFAFHLPSRAGLRHDHPRCILYHLLLLRIYLRHPPAVQVRIHATRYPCGDTLNSLFLILRRPELALAMCVCGSKAERLAQSLMASRKREGRARAAGGAGDSTGGGGPDMAMMLNPQLMQQSKSGGSESMVTAELVESLEDAPSPTQWAQMRGNIASVLRNAKSLAAENATLKRNLERAEAGDGLLAAGTHGATALAAKSKREFSQVGSSGRLSVAGGQGLPRSPSVRAFASSRAVGGGSSSAVELAPFMSTANPLSGGGSLPSGRRVSVAVSRGKSQRAGATAGVTDSPLVAAGAAASQRRPDDVSPLLPPRDGGAVPDLPDDSKL